MLTIHFGCHGVIYINSKDFPISFSFIQHGHHAQNLNLLDLALFSDSLTNLNDINWVVISFCICLGMNIGWVFPSLESTMLFVWKLNTTKTKPLIPKSITPYLRQSAIIPDISLVWEAVSYKSGLSFLDVLLEWVILFSSRDLNTFR